MTLLIHIVGAGDLGIDTHQYQIWPTLNKIASRSCVRWKLRGASYRMRACLLM